MAVAGFPDCVRHREPHQRRGEKSYGRVSENHGPDPRPPLLIGCKHRVLGQVTRQHGNDEHGDDGSRQTAACLQRAKSDALCRVAAPFPGGPDQRAPEQEDRRDAPEAVQGRHLQCTGNGRHVQAAETRRDERRRQQRACREAVGEHAAREVRQHRSNAVHGEQVT